MHCHTILKMQHKYLHNQIHRKMLVLQRMIKLKNCATARNDKVKIMCACAFDRQKIALTLAGWNWFQFHQCWASRTSWRRLTWARTCPSSATPRPTHPPSTTGSLSGVIWSYQVSPFHYLSPTRMSHCNRTLNRSQTTSAPPWALSWAMMMLFFLPFFIYIINVNCSCCLIKSFHHLVDSELLKI